jgi:hypothetical protein
VKRPKQPWPKGPYSIGVIGDVARILDADGNDVMTQRGGMQRLLECANALDGIWFPLAHVPATEDYNRRLVAMLREKGLLPPLPPSNDGEGLSL